MSGHSGPGLANGGKQWVPEDGVVRGKLGHRQGRASGGRASSGRAGPRLQASGAGQGRRLNVADAGGAAGRRRGRSVFRGGSGRPRRRPPAASRPPRLPAVRGRRSPRVEVLEEAPQVHGGELTAASSLLPRPPRSAVCCALQRVHGASAGRVTVVAAAASRRNLEAPPPSRFRKAAAHAP